MIQKLFFWLTFCVLWLSFSHFASAQSPDDVLWSILTDTSSTGSPWWYAANDKEKIKFISFSWGILVLEAPVAQKDAKILPNYYITWWPISYQEITTTNSAQDLQKIQDSDTYKSTNGKSVYEVKNWVLLLSLPTLAWSKDLYVTIIPLDDSGTQWEIIEDYKIDLTTQKAGSQVLADNFSNPNSNQAISSISCIWASTENRVTLTWNVNTALNATNVEIYHRGDSNQWPMELKWTVAINSKTFTVSTPHRNEQLFRFRAVNSNGALVWSEIQYQCSSDAGSSVTGTTTTTTTDTPAIPVVPWTWPKETFALILLFSWIAYILFKKFKKA